jgi:hypothetical protein
VPEGDRVRPPTPRAGDGHEVSRGVKLGALGGAFIGVIVGHFR